MKATNSNDGTKRFTVTCKLRIGIDEMIDGLGYKLVREAPIDHANPAKSVTASLKPYRSRKAIMDTAINSRLHEGESIWTWQDDCTAVVANEIRNQVRVLVAEKFPELHS